MRMKLCLQKLLGTKQYLKAISIPWSNAAEVEVLEWLMVPPVVVWTTLERRPS